MEEEKLEKITDLKKLEQNVSSLMKQMEMFEIKLKNLEETTVKAVVEKMADLGPQYKGK